MLKRFTPVLALLSLCISVSADAADDEILILKKTASSSAKDLLDPSDPARQRELSPGQADALSLKQDISKLDPKPRDAWRPEILEHSNAAKFNYPPNGAEIMFRDEMDSVGKYRAQVQYQGRDFRLVVDMNGHETLASAALLRRLGYPQDSPKDYRKLTLRFPDEEKYNAFFTSLVMLTRFKADNWVVSRDPKKLEVVLQDVILEQPNIEDTQYFAGQLAVSFIDDYRAPRGLIVPLSLLDVRMSARGANLYSWELGREMSQRIVLKHPIASVFASKTTYEDAKWAARRIAKMIEDRYEVDATGKQIRIAASKSDPKSYREAFRRIWAESYFPEEVQEALLERVIARRNNMIQLFGLTEELAAEGYLTQVPFTDKLNTRGGAVVRGEIVKERFPGYAGLYTVGDPDSPLRWSEIKHYIKMEGISQAINVATNYMNEALQIHTIEEGGKKRTEQFVRQVAEACAKQAQENPGEPCRYQVPLKAWAMPLTGFHVSANRSLVTGTYYGSDAKAQLVDNISIGVNIGAFGGTTAIEGALKNLGASGSVGYQRAYTHVRPIMSLEASKKESWANLFIPAFMKKQARMMAVPKKDGKYADADVTAALKEFIDGIGDGEVFTITDAFVANVSPQFTIPLTALVGPGLDKLGPSIGVGVTGDWAIMKRTMITKRSGRIEVYDNRMNTRAIGANMSLNFWIQLAKVSAERKKGTGNTDVMSIDLSPATVKDKTENKHYAEERRKMMFALKSIYETNEIDTAKEFYPPTNVDHELKSTLLRAKVLLWSWATYEENHKVKVTLPEILAPHIDASKRERILYSSKKTAIRGRDIYGFAGTLVSKVSGIEGLLDRGANLNDSGTFLGKASWSTVRTEAELTPGVEYRPMSFMEEYVSGWNLSHDKLIEILSALEDRVDHVNGKSTIPLFNRSVFTSTTALQTFEIRSSVLIYASGVENFKNYITTEKCEKGRKCRTLLVKLVDLVDPEDLRKSCRKYVMNDVKDAELDALDLTDAAYEKATMSNKFWRKCITPWMRKTIKLVRKMPEPKDLEGTNQQLNTIFYVVSKHADLGQFLARLGQDEKDFFFQVRVSGFRKGDENGDQEYLTSSIGSAIDEGKVNLGPFANFKLYDLNKPEIDKDGKLVLDEFGNPKYPQWKISDYELQGRYFGSGL